MISHLKESKPSLSDLTYEEKRLIHIEVRKGRLVRKLVTGFKKVKSPELKAKEQKDKKDKKTNDLISGMTVTEIAQLQAEIKRRKEAANG